MNQIQKIHEHIDDHFSEHVEKLRKNLRQPSLSLTEPLYINEDVTKAAEILANCIRDCEPKEVEVAETDGYPVVYGMVKSKNPKAKTLILYSLNDTMPTDEPNWKAPPFAADILNAEEIGLPKFYGKCIVARGARNQKGPTVGFINALRSMQEVTGDIPVNVIFCVEGEEELGSPHLTQFRDAHLNKLKKADAVLYPNPSQDMEGLHHVYLGFRGIIFLELEVKGGDWGGPVERQLFSTDDAWIDAPAWRLIWALSTLKNAQGKVLIDGFYDNLRPKTPEEEENLKVLLGTFNEENTKKRLGIKRFKLGLPGKDLYKKYITDPLVNIDGIVGGYTGPAIKTSFPQSAKAKMDIRLFPNMGVNDTLAKLRKHLDQHGFSEVEIHKQSGYNWSSTPANADVVRAAISSAKKYGVESICWPIYLGSAPLSVFSEPPLKLPCVSAGLGRMGGSHEVNEYMTIDGLRAFEKYIVTFLYEYGGP